MLLRITYRYFHNDPDENSLISRVDLTILISRKFSLDFNWTLPSTGFPSPPYVLITLLICELKEAAVAAGGQRPTAHAPSVHLETHLHLRDTRPPGAPLIAWTSLWGAERRLERVHGWGSTSISTGCPADRPALFGRIEIFSHPLFFFLWLFSVYYLKIIYIWKVFIPVEAVFMNLLKLVPHFEIYKYKAEQPGTTGVPLCVYCKYQKFNIIISHF